MPVRLAKQNKYGNRRCEIDGHVFDSQAEARRYRELKLLESAGVIDGLRLQPRYPFIYEGQVIAVYKADFSYIAEGQIIVEDVKSPATRSNPVYRLKKRMLKIFFDLDVVEVA